MPGGFDLTKHINVRDPELLEIFRQILDRRRAGSLKLAGASNMIKEEIGERNALNRIQSRFPGSRQLVMATRSNGVPVLDLLLVTEDGKMIVVEAKFSSSGRLNLGRSNSRLWLNTKRGWRAVKIRRGTSQMSPRWIENRVIELEKMGERRLAGRLKQALFNNNFEAYSVVTDRTGEVLTVRNHTPEWRQSFSRRGVEFRPQVAAAEATVAEGSAARSVAAGDRAVANRITAGSVREAEVLAGRQATSLAVREGAQVAIRGATIRGAARVVARVLVAVISRVIMILNVVGLALLAVEILGMIWAHFREKAINAAIEKALQTNIPAEINAGLERHKDEIARIYARAWVNKRGQNPVFMYLSPRMVVEGGDTKDGIKFEAHVPVQSILNDLVSTRFIEATRDDIVPDTRSYYKIQIRWSVEQPVFTPFDIYLAYIDFVVEHIVDSWATLYGTGVKIPPATEKLFHSTVETLAEISATLKYEPWFGYDSYRRSFPPNQVAGERWEALQALSVKIDKQLMPKVSTLESKGLINTATVRFEAYVSPLRSEIDPRGEESLLPTLRRLAIDMKYLDSKYLEYERFETMHAKARAGNRMEAIIFMATIEGQKMLDLREFLQPVRRYLSGALAKEPFILDLTHAPAGSLVLDPNVP